MAMADWRRPSRSVMTKMMKESVRTGHPTGLPDKLVRLFAPGAPLAHIPENCQQQRRKPKQPITGISALVKEFAAPGDPEYEPPAPAAQFPEPRLFKNKEYALQVRLDEETKLEKQRRLHEWRTDKNKRELEEKIASYDPNENDPMIEGDPYKTLFVSRLSFDVTERKLRHEFEEYGPIRRVRLVHDRNTDKPRGYAFIEYEHKSDMKEAYKQSDGRKIEGRRILVDVERGRTVDNWRPMRLGGGLGGDSRLPKEPKKKILADAAAKGLPPPMAAGRPDRPPIGGGFRGGYGGGGGYSGGGGGGRGPPGGGYGGDRGSGGYGDRGGGGYGDRDRGSGGYGADRDRGSYGDRGGDRGGGGGYGDRDRDRGGDRYDRDKRPRDYSPPRDYKRGRHDDDRKRYERDY